MMIFDCFVSLLFMFCELTFFHPSLEGQVMRNGEVFRGDDPSIVACGVDAEGEPLIPLGSKLTICRANLSKCVDATVVDTGLMPGNDLDASETLFEKLAPLSAGRIRIVWHER